MPPKVLTILVIRGCKRFIQPTWCDGRAHNFKMHMPLEMVGRVSQVIWHDKSKELCHFSL